MQHPIQSFPLHFTSGHPIDAHPFCSITIRPPVPEIQFDHENSRSNVNIKGTLVTATSSRLIFLVFHIRASYQHPFFLFNDNQAFHSRDSIWPWKFKVKGQERRYPCHFSIHLTHFLIVSYQLDEPFIREILRKKFVKKQFPTEFLQNLIRWHAWGTGYIYQVCSEWMNGSYFITGTN